MKQKALAALLLATFAAAPAAASDMERLAQRLGKAARSAGIARVAVFAFKPASGEETSSGSALRDALVVALTRDGRVSAVDRSLATEPGALHRAPVEGVMIGSYEKQGRTLRFLARVVRLEDHRVVAEDRGEAAAADSDAAQATGSLTAAADEGLIGALYAITQDCADASERVNRLQAPVVALEARYWALRLRLDEEAVRRGAGPGADIVDPALRERFDRALNEWRARPAIPSVTEEDLSLLSSIQEESSTLARDCSLSAATARKSSRPQGPMTASL